MDRGDTECPDKHSGDDPKHAQLPGGGLAVQPCLAIDEEQSDCCVCYNGYLHDVPFPGMDTTMGMCS
ncbi:hypothetical protein SARC_07841 [Sphaeroforma arctica JP610]|uniref:Uncharacterized protein n=1 Tax=Sphaeroforma arctica JP610 TaxID=667725 RepID=A0A0L0FV03_9EUKA|nr:hypothetical protein SARC_07841 [Sphaeroforma arctica JP610]KNC79768.1 hypothetical protein SARC_07841 [Sphaeroforma arctica JP610]|eukprot:XP_014153670.1 hypothetical protein SARC_07841 [Sphaeroforma arctica JP610]